MYYLSPALDDHAVASFNTTVVLISRNLVEVRGLSYKFAHIEGVYVSHEATTHNVDAQTSWSMCAPPKGSN